MILFIFAVEFRMLFRITTMRAIEITSLTWEQIDLKTREIKVIRAKGGKNSMHLMTDQEVRALRKMKKESDGSDFVSMGLRIDQQRSNRFAHNSDYMGHANIANTVKYTELSSKKFKKVNHIL